MIHNIAHLVKWICPEAQSVSAVQVMKHHSVTRVHMATLVDHQIYDADHVTAMETLIRMYLGHVTKRLVYV